MLRNDSGQFQLDEETKRTNETYFKARYLVYVAIKQTIKYFLALLSV